MGTMRMFLPVYEAKKCVVYHWDSSRYSSSLDKGKVGMPREI